MAHPVSLIEPLIVSPTRPAPRMRGSGKSATTLVDNSDNGPDVTRMSNRSPWPTSFWLWRSTLSSFIVLFTLLWLSLIVIWRVIHEQNGFRLTITSNHYAWTYGPTAVLVIVASMWRQVDYHTKAEQPWHAMRKAFTPASRSLFLDYISPIQFSSFAMALKHRHWSVVTSIAAFVTLKGVILVSTGLFLPLPTSTTVEVPITLTDTFDGTDFWTRTSPVDYSIGNGNATISTATQAILPAISYDLAYTLNISNAISTNLERLQNVTVPDGVKNNIVFQSFHPAPPRKNLKTVSYTVDAFVPAISCETAMTSWYKPGGRSGTVNFALDTATCSVGHENQQVVFSGVNINAPYQNYTESYSVQRVNCSSRNASVAEVVFLNDNTPAVYRLAFLAVTFTNEQYQDRNNPSDPNDTLTLIDATPQKFAAAICDVDYTMVKARVTYDLGNNETSVLVQDHPATNVYLSTLTKLELMEILYDGLSEAPRADLGVSSYDPTGWFAASALMYETMAQTLAGNQSLVQFFDAETLNSAAGAALSGLAAQFMASNYLTSEFLNETGSATLVELRLHLGEVSLWLMVAGLILLSTMALIMLVITQRSMAPRRQSLVAVRAALLTSNLAIQRLFAGSGGMDLESLLQKFEGYQFRTSFSMESLSIIPKRPIVSASTSNPEAKHPKRSWAPYAGRRHAVILILLSPVLAIIALEVLHQLSQQNDGICTTDGDSSAALYAIRYSSTLTVLLIATLYNCLDFAAADMAPYSAMRSHHKTAQRSMLCEFLGSLPPLTIFNALRARHIGVALAALAALVGSFLTIIVSGLWVTDTFATQSYSVQASLNNTWDIDWLNSSYNDNGAATAFFKLYYGQIIPPANIWKNIVLPEVSSVSTSTDIHGQSIFDGTNQLNYTFRVPALRSQLSCHIIPPEQIAIDYQGFFSGPNVYVTVATATINLPQGCLTGPYGNVSNLVIRGEYNGLSADSSGWYGQFNDLHMGPWNASVPGWSSWAEYGTPSGQLQPDNPAGCPSLAALFGYWGSNRSTVENVTAMWCAQNVQQVPTLVTYNGNPKFAQLSASHPPAPVESSVRNLTNGTNGVTGFPYRVSAHWSYFPSLNHVFSDNIDNFFGYLIYGPGGTPKEDLLGSENAGRLVERINELYQSYMVQVINSNFRVEPSESIDSTLNGEATIFVNRLKVNQGSKITLQIMLGTMLGLGMTAYCLVDLRGTLPCEPCSIGATFSLLADSELCDRLHLPVGSEFMSKKELNHVLAGMRFGLGWWRHRRVNRDDTIANAGADVSPKPQRFGIDIGIPNAAGFDEKSGSRLGSRLHRRKKRDSPLTNIWE